MVVDSSALPEQVVADVLASAFDSAGQRCSALRVLCLQEDVADAHARHAEGRDGRAGGGQSATGSSTDVGPVITPTARDAIVAHIDAMRAEGRAVHAAALPAACAARQLRRRPR